MELKVAEALSVLMMRITANLDDSVALVRDNCTVDELAWYRREVGKVLGTLYLDVEQKIWSEHPSLKPQQLGGTYVVDPTIYEPRFYAVRRASDL